MIKRFFDRYPVKTRRLLEILIGSLTWILITSPLWATFLVPTLMAYFIVAMTVYWFYKSGTFSFFLILGYRKMRKAQKTDWQALAKKLPDFTKVHHLMIIPNYKEVLEKLIPTFEAIVSQTFPTSRITVILALEEREGQAAVTRAKEIEKRYKRKLGGFFYTVHPDLPGEVKGKSSNEAWAGKWAKKKLVDEQGKDINYLTVTSCDADAVLPEHYFANLTYCFLKNPNRYRTFWQGAILEYNNIWRTTAPIRMVSTLSSVFKIAHLMLPHEMTPYSTYSASLKMIDEVGYWDTDVIPEDWHMFFKCFFNLGGTVEVEPLYLPVFIDAIEGKTFWQAIKNRYEQNRRHAWGVTDIPYIIRQWFSRPEIPLFGKTYRVLKAFETHFVWPTNWFLLTLGVNLPSFINHAFAKTVVGYTFPSFSRFILTVSLVFCFVFIVIDWLIRPPRPVYFKKPAFIPSYLQWLAMPIISLFASALPGLDAHTRVMLGKRIEYRVTEKL